MNMHFQEEFNQKQNETFDSIVFYAVGFISIEILYQHPNAEQTQHDSNN